MDKAKVSAALLKTTGGVFVAPSGTALPTNATATLNAAFVDVGHVGDAGITNSNTPSSEKVKNMNGDTVLVFSSEKPDIFTIPFLESLNANLLKLVYGDDNVTVDSSTGAITITANAATAEEMCMVIELVLNSDTIKRIVIPAATVSEIGDITYVNNAAITYELTIEALVDTSGNTHYEYIASA